MSRSSLSEKARRVNFALSLLQKHASWSEAAKELSQACSMSLRQSYRYLELANELDDVLPVPEEKVVFTVKLPESLVEDLRLLSQSSNETLSDLTRQALDSYVQEKRTHGTERRTSD